MAQANDPYTTVRNHCPRCGKLPVEDDTFIGFVYRSRGPRFRNVVRRMLRAAAIAAPALYLTVELKLPQTVAGTITEPTTTPGIERIGPWTTEVNVTLR